MVDICKYMVYLKSIMALIDCLRTFTSRISSNPLVPGVHGKAIHT